MKAVNQPNEILLPIYNLDDLLIEKGQYKKCYALINEFLNSDERKNIDNIFYHRIRFQYIISMQALDMNDSAAHYSEQLILDESIPFDIKVDTLNQLVYYYTVINYDESAALPYVEQLIKDLEYSDQLPSELIVRSQNHIVFYYLSFGHLNKAEHILLSMSNYIHKDPFITATFGMYHIIKGNIERGKEYYLQAIRMVSDAKLQRRIKQRMHYEIGKALYFVNDYRNAKKQLEKALQVKDGFKYVNTQIKKYQRKLN